MIRLSRLTDYAIVIVAELSRQPGQLLAAAALAQRTGIPEPTVAKVLKILARSGVVDSSRGVNGGYLVMRGPAQICLIELVEAMNGPITLTDCTEGSDEDCGILETCLLRGRWQPVNTAIRAAFSAIHLSDMIADPEGVALPLAPMQEEARSGCGSCGCGRVAVGGGCHAGD